MLLHLLSFSNLSGLIIKIKECGANIRADLFIPDIGNRSNQEILKELVKRAQKVNSYKSTKTDYRKYCDIRNNMIFMENIYKYREEIVGESSFRSTHPLLFRSVGDVIEDGTVLNNKLSNDIQEKYALG